MKNTKELADKLQQAGVFSFTEQVAIVVAMEAAAKNMQVARDSDDPEEKLFLEEKSREWGSLVVNQLLKFNA